MKAARGNVPSFLDFYGKMVQFQAVSLVVFWVTVFDLFFFGLKDSHAWVSSILYLVYLCIVFRKNLPVLVILLFAIPYIFVPYYFFVEGMKVSHWSSFQSPQYFNITSILALLFFYGFSIFLVGVKDETLLSKRFASVLQDRLLFYCTIALLIIISVLGLQGQNLLVSNEYGYENVSKSPLYEYFVVFSLFSFYFMNRESRLEKILLFMVLLFYISKTFLYGGRIEVVQLGLLSVYVWKGFFYKKQRKFWVVSFLGFFVIELVGMFRTDPLNFLVAFVNFFDIANESVAKDSSQILSNQFGDVYQSTLRIVGMVQSEILVWQTRASSLFQVLAGLFLPPSARTDAYNLSRIYYSEFGSGGGGLIFGYAYAWLSYIGPVLMGVFLGVVIRLFYERDNLFINSFGLMVLVTFPRWFSYYPVVIFKMCALAIFLMILVLVVKVSVSKINRESF